MPDAKPSDEVSPVIMISFVVLLIALGLAIHFMPDRIDQSQPPPLRLGAPVSIGTVP